MLMQVLESVAPLPMRQCAWLVVSGLARSLAEAQSHESTSAGLGLGMAYFFGLLFLFLLASEVGLLLHPSGANPDSYACMSNHVAKFG